MRENDLTSKIISLIKGIVIIAIVAFAIYTAYRILVPKVTDVTPYINTEKSVIESELGVSLPSAPDMISKICNYTKGELTVCGSSKDGIAVVYIDGLQAGLHIDNAKYSLFNIQLNNSSYLAEDNMTFTYDESFKVLDDMADDTATATFYTNSTTNKCLVVVYNDLVNKAVAITYINNMKKFTEKLSAI